MAITHIATSTPATGAAGGSTSAINTTGATLLVLSVSWYSGTTTALTVSDNKSNTWIPLTLRNAGNAAHRFYYAASPTVGTGHTATVTGATIYAAFTLAAYATVAPAAPFVSENGATATGGSSLATGSVTPATSGALIVSGWAGMNGTSSPTVGAGLTQTSSQNPVASTCVAGASAYLVQTPAAAINPTWSWAGTDHVAASIAVFAPAVAAAARTSQLAIEVLGGTEAAVPPLDGRVTQLAVETLTLIPGGPGRVTQQAVEVFTGLVVPGRVTQTAVEVFVVGPGAVRVTQVAVELFLILPPPEQVRRGNEIRRLRRAAHLTTEDKQVFYRRFALELERGQGTASGPGSDPQVLFRMSRDGGQTWGEPILLPAGRIGEYTRRAVATRLGVARDAVFEIVVSDPIAWSIVGAWLELESGNH